VLIFLFAVVAVVVCVVFIFVCTIEVKAWWQSPWMRLFRLGGVTTLGQKLNYPCTCHAQILNNKIGCKPYV
jgi:hypothetical protein